MITFRNLILIISLIVFCGCSKLPKSVFTDKQTTYQKSKDLPALEIPPDLTITEGENKAVIPGEAESTTLSEFQRQRDQRVKRGNIVLGTGEDGDEQWLSLQGTSSDIWSRLRQFWRDEGYKTELDDEELGVFETDWKQRDSYRNRYKIFAEPSEQGDTILFLSSERQEHSEGEWFDSVPDVRLEKEILRQLNLHFYGTAISDNTIVETPKESIQPKEPISRKPTTEIVDIGEGKIYLVVPQEFTRVWHHTETVVLQAGYILQDKDQEKGTYNFLYIKPEGEKKKKGFLSKLKFWGDDKDEGIPYQLSLTGVGDKTEAIIVNKDGEWETGSDAVAILDALSALYDQLEQ